MLSTRCHVQSPVAETGLPATLVDLLRARAEATPDRISFRFVRDHGGEELSLTYSELHERAMAIAGELQTLAAPGDRALLLFPPGLEFVPAFFGCLYAGLVAVPVAPPGRSRLTSSVMAIFQASQPALILSTADHCAQAERSYSHLSELLGRPWIATDCVAASRQHTWNDPQLDGRQTAFLQFTSGSTSSPKGVILSHENLIYNAALIQQAFGTTSENSAVFWLPLYHDMGLIGGVVQPIYAGGPCTLLAAAAFLQRPALWLETISRLQATISGGPDFAYDLCARKISPQERARLDLRTWEVAFTGAERIRPQTLERFADAFAPCGFRREAFLPCYGLAEGTLIVSGGPRGRAPKVARVQADALTRHQVREASPDEAMVRSFVGCGENLPGQSIRIVDPQTRLPCAGADVGEIWVQGPSVAGGYYEQPEATATAFGGHLADTGDGPFLRTGDLGFLRDGQLFVTGRLKDLVIIRGRNYYPEDVEHAVEGAHAALRAGSCAVFSVDVQDRERLVIVQEIEPRWRERNTDDVVQAIRAAVASRHTVEIYAIVLVKAGEIPKTSSGKTRRSDCRQRYLGGELGIIVAWKSDLEEAEDEAWDDQPAPSPRSVNANEIESWLTQRIAARLNLPPAQVRGTTPFLEFGMGSLDAVEIAGELERWLGRRLSPTAIYNHPNIGSLAQWLASAPAGPQSAGPTPSTGLPSEATPAGLLEEVREMTEDEMGAFIREEMAKLGPA